MSQYIQCYICPHCCNDHPREWSKYCQEAVEHFIEAKLTKLLEMAREEDPTKATQFFWQRNFMYTTDQLIEKTKKSV